MDHDHPIPLDLLHPGQWAEIAEVLGDPPWVTRMAELGIRPGHRIRVVRAGSPCILEVDGARLSLRGDWALQIYVRPRLEQVA